MSIKMVYGLIILVIFNNKKRTVKHPKTWEELKTF